MKLRKIVLSSPIYFGVLCYGSHRASATENGLTEYPVGINTVLPGIHPSPNTTQLLTYVEYYDADSFLGGSGQKSFPEFHANIGVAATRILHGWNYTYGPLSFSSGLVVEAIANDFHVAGLNSTTVGLLDVVLQPVYIDYRNASHTIFGYLGGEITVPTGNYKVDNLVNLGLNYYTLSPNLGLTYFANPRLPLSLEIHADLPVTTNNATHYHSGNSIDVELAVDWNVFPSLPKLFFGIQGYYFQQFSDDTVDDVRYLDGFRGQALSIGPQVRYDWRGGGIAGKIQPEFAVQNRTKGTRFWIEFALPIE